MLLWKFHLSFRLLVYTVKSLSAMM